MLRIVLQRPSLLILTGCLLFIPERLPAGLITFEGPGLGHGTVINTQFSGHSFLFDNFFIGEDVGALFDSTETGTQDPDLEDPWQGGNLPLDTVLGNLLIIVENHPDGIDYTDGSNTTIKKDDVDDEGRRPAGTITINFDTPITEFGFDFVDIENITESSSSYVAALFTSGGTEIGSIGFDQFKSGGLFDNAAVFGNNHINRISPIMISDINSSYSSASSIVFTLGGSGAIDNIHTTPVPEPSSIMLLAGGVVGFVVFGRRQKKRQAS